MLTTLYTTAWAQKIDRSQKPKAGPAAMIRISDPVTFTLPNGIKVLVVENHKLPAVSASLTIDRTPVLQGEKTGIMGIMGGMLQEGTLTRSKAEFDEEVDFISATVSLSSEGGSVAALSRHFDKAFGLMADGLLHPRFSPESLDKLKTRQLTVLTAMEKNPSAIGNRVINAVLYGANHPFGEFETAEKISSLQLDDIKECYKQYMIPNNAYLVVVGDITVDKVKEMARKWLGGWKRGTTTNTQLVKPINVNETEIDLIDNPNSVQASVNVVNLIESSKKNPDYFALLVANQVLGGGANGYLFLNLREKHGYTYGASSKVFQDKFGAMFMAGASVRNAVVDSAIIQLLHEINRISSEKVEAKNLQRVKNGYNGSFALGLENKRMMADFALDIEREGLPKTFYKAYLQKINAVTAEDIQRVAKKYFLPNRARIFVVGKASEIAPKLEKLGYKINYFDIYARPVAAPVSNKKADTGVSAKSVIEKYITAIGGRDAVRKITSMSMEAEGTVNGGGFMTSTKLMLPNRSLMVMNYMGNTVMKYVFDGEKGYQEAEGNKAQLPPDVTKMHTEKKSLFPELYYEQDKFLLSLEGKTKVNDKDAHKIKVSSPSGVVEYRYYEISTGLLLKVESSIKPSSGESGEESGEEMNTGQEYDEYKPVNGVMFPHSIAAIFGPQKINMKVTSVKVNEGVSEEDFK